MKKKELKIIIEDCEDTIESSKEKIIYYRKEIQQSKKLIKINEKLLEETKLELREKNK